LREYHTKYVYAFKVKILTHKLDIWYLMGSQWAKSPNKQSLGVIEIELMSQKLFLCIYMYLK